MRERALHVDLPDDSSLSVWPWIVTLVSAIGLLLASRAVIATVPASLLAQARVVVAESEESGVTVSGSGRDLTLNGILNTGADRDLFVQRIASINGVRSVSESLTVFDPVSAARESRAAFASSIGNLDMSAVAFEPGSSSFAAGSDRALAELATLLKTWPEYRVRIAGHTDNTGRSQVNLRLSRERARAVADWLVGRGASQEQVIAQGYGATQPIADNTTDAGRSRNRRIEVRYVD